MEQVDKLKRTWNLTPVLQIVQKIPENYFPCLYLSIGQFGDIVNCGSEDIFKNASCLMHNTHHDVKDLVNHGIVKNTKTWIAWEWNITFLQYKKSLTCASDGSLTIIYDVRNLNKLKIIQNTEDILVNYVAKIPIFSMFSVPYGYWTKSSHVPNKHERRLLHPKRHKD